jgi:hypothetical protein
MSMMHPRLSPLAILLVAACSEDVTLLEETETAIGAAGGQARSADGELTLTFPPGALASEVRISIETRRDVPASFRGRIYELGPSGLQFASPVGAEVTGLPPSTRRLALASFDSTPPVALDGSTYVRTENRVVAELEHFSSYGVVEVDEPSPCAGLSCGDACSTTTSSGAAAACDATGACVPGPVDCSGDCTEPMHCPCTTDQDCRGSLVCRYARLQDRYLCVAACGGSEECPAEYPVCMETMIYVPQCCPAGDATRCQECRTDSDCPPGLSCTNTSSGAVSLGQTCR